MKHLWGSGDFAFAFTAQSKIPLAFDVWINCRQEKWKETKPMCNIFIDYVSIADGTGRSFFQSHFLRSLRIWKIPTIQHEAFIECENVFDKRFARPRKWRLSISPPYIARLSLPPFKGWVALYSLVVVRLFELTRTENFSTLWRSTLYKLYIFWKLMASTIHWPADHPLTCHPTLDRVPAWLPISSGLGNLTTHHPHKPTTHIQLATSNNHSRNSSCISSPYNHLSLAQLFSIWLRRTMFSRWVKIFAPGIRHICKFPRTVTGTISWRGASYDVEILHRI